MPDRATPGRKALHSQLGVQSIMAGRSWWQEPEVAAHTVYVQLGSRTWPTLVLYSLSPFVPSGTPSLWDGATHIYSVSFPHRQAWKLASQAIWIPPSFQPAIHDHRIDLSSVPLPQNPHASYSSFSYVAAIKHTNQNQLGRGECLF